MRNWKKPGDEAIEIFVDGVPFHISQESQGPILELEKKVDDCSKVVTTYTAHLHSHTHHLTHVLTGCCSG